MKWLNNIWTGLKIALGVLFVVINGMIIRLFSKDTDFDLDDQIEDIKEKEKNEIKKIRNMSIDDKYNHAKQLLKRRRKR